ncbi:hypothetical protein ACF0H5_019978 [Mactra antiquata]
MSVRLIFLQILCCWTFAQESFTVRDVNNLTNKLLNGYNKNTLPSSNFSEQFKVDVKAYPIALGDIDEVEEKLSTVMGFIMSWTDDSIAWAPEWELGITNITLGLSEVWKPNIMLLNPHQNVIKGHGDMSSSSVSYYYNGTTHWTRLVTLQTTCDLDTTFFPFDIQECFITIYLSGNDAYEIIVNADWDGNAVFEKENGAWKVVGQTIQGSRNSLMNISYKFERKPLFMLVNILLPIIVLALLAPLVFLMPKNSGERVGYAITMLLALSVYMTIISDNLPKNSNPMPLISIMIFIWYILNSSIVLIVIMNTKINHIKDDRPIPGCVRGFVMFTRLIVQKDKLHGLGTPEESENCLEKKETETKDEMNGKLESTGKSRVQKVTWQEVSVAIDRWCLVWVYFIKILLPIVFFSVMKAGNSRKKED